jgi:AbrB family looped-hinge helix DNA binding protein
MKTETASATVGDRFQIVIPKNIRQGMGLKPRMKVRFDRKNGVVTLRPERDLTRFDEAIKKWAGTGRSLKEDGFDSVDDYIEFMRGR